MLLTFYLCSIISRLFIPLVTKWMQATHRRRPFTSTAIVCRGVIQSWSFCLGLFIQVPAGDEAERKKLLGECFEKRAIHLNEEGLVVKDLHGHYVVRWYWGRAGVTWFTTACGMLLIRVWFVMSCQRRGERTFSDDILGVFRL